MHKGPSRAICITNYRNCLSYFSTWSPCFATHIHRLADQTVSILNRHSSVCRLGRHCRPGKLDFAQKMADNRDDPERYSLKVICLLCSNKTFVPITKYTFSVPQISCLRYKYVTNLCQFSARKILPSSSHSAQKT